MMIRILIVMLLAVSLFVVTGCLDDASKADIESVDAWFTARIAETGELIVVRRTDLVDNQSRVAKLLQQSKDDWEGISILVTLAGGSGVGVVTLIRKVIKWRGVAWDAVQGMERGKIESSGNNFVVSKTVASRHMRPASRAVIEAMREKVKLLHAAEKSMQTDAAAESSDPTQVSG